MTDKKWWLAGALIVVVIAIGIVVNINSNDNDPTKITGLINIDNGDLNINWDRYTATNIELTESVSITDSGIYHLTGTLSDGSITVDTGEKGEVKLILDNVGIQNTSGPAINCVSGDDLVIELIGENTLDDSASYSSDLDQDIEGAIYSKADLTLQGDGALKVTGYYQDAIVGKDDVKFVSGVYNITAADDGIRGKDSVYIAGGEISINSKADAIKSTNYTDSGKGFVLVENGVLNISAGDDAIHGERVLAVQDGEINVVKSYEGFEAQKIVINGGELSVTASDDGINAGSISSDTTTTNNGRKDPLAADENCELIINGGNIYVNSGGDGVDSNGWIYFNGGNTVVDGPANNGNGALDSGAGIIMNGGSVVAVGSSGMAEAPGSNSNVFSASIYFSSANKAGTILEIKDSANATIVTHTSAKTFSHATIGSDKFNFGDTYSIYLNGEKYQDFIISDTVTMVGSSHSNTNILPGRR
ncbi:carbohydrate-binding domain-containing protein [Candidatus Saccharibacteria bacterium]|nr:carbohydrate-binding domain-containing protein [Candidatus Saccharibacteria bacterium]